jgi:hypothetical protein
VDSKEIKELFQDSLDGVADVMKEQLRMAQQKGCEVKVANIPSLDFIHQAHLTHRKLFSWVGLDNQNPCPPT